MDLQESDYDNLIIIIFCSGSMCVYVLHFILQWEPKNISSTEFLKARLFFSNFINCCLQQVET